MIIIMIIIFIELWLMFFGLFLLAIICFCVFGYFKWFKDEKLFKNKYADY